MCPATATVYDDRVIRPLARPLQKGGGLKVLVGSLAPDGCVIKTSAAAKRLHRHVGRAVVFDGMADLKRRIDSPELAVDANSVLVLRGVGAGGGRRGCRSGGSCRFLKELLAAGVRDLLRLSDARMSGTSYGACVLHIAPEAAVGGHFGVGARWG